MTILVDETIQHTYRRLNQESDAGKGGRKGPERNHGLLDQRGPSGRDTCTRKRLLHAGRIFIGDGLRFWQCRTTEHGQKARVRVESIRERLETGGLAVQIELGFGTAKVEVARCKTLNGEAESERKKRICACAKDDGSTVHTHTHSDKNNKRQSGERANVRTEGVNVCGGDGWRMEYGTGPAQAAPRPVWTGCLAFTWTPARQCTQQHVHKVLYYHAAHRSRPASHGTLEHGESRSRPRGISQPLHAQPIAQGFAEPWKSTGGPVTTHCNPLERIIRRQQSTCIATLPAFSSPGNQPTRYPLGKPSLHTQDTLSFVSLSTQTRLLN